MGASAVAGFGSTEPCCRSWRGLRHCLYIEGSQAYKATKWLHCDSYDRKGSRAVLVNCTTEDVYASLWQNVFADLGMLAASAFKSRGLRERLGMRPS